MKSEVCLQWCGVSNCVDAHACVTRQRGTIMLAARDKWWIEKLQEEQDLIRISGDSVHLDGYYVAIPEKRWKSLKQSLEVAVTDIKTNGECQDCLNHIEEHPDDACWVGVFPEYNRNMECKSFKQSLEVKE
jgi:hypothetical protein